MTARTAKGLCGNLLPCLDHSEVGKPSTEALAKTNMGTITSEEIIEMMRPAPNAAAMLITPKGIFHVRTDSPLWVRLPGSIAGTFSPLGLCPAMTVNLNPPQHKI